MMGLLQAGCGWGPSWTLACQDYAEARCERRDDCSAGFNLRTLYGDLATCVAREQLSCTLGAGAPGATNTPVTVEECAVAMRAMGCADFFASHMPPVCRFTGTRAMGAPCAFGGQCASSYCSGNKTAICGTCGPPPVEGAPCVESSCGFDLQCVQRTQICQAVPMAGMPCDQNAIPCGVDLACITAAVGVTAGTCMTSIATPGQACGGSLGGCDSSIGLTCGGIASSQRTCQPIATGSDGVACGALTTGTFAACSAGACYTANGIALVGEIGACKTDAADGQPCDPTHGPSCVLPARCVAGFCTLPVPATCG
jgi:hypothetical protein